MQAGEYITDRSIVRIVTSICNEQNIAFRTYSDEWLLELQNDKVTRHIFGYKFPLNSSVAASIAQDKVAAYQLLSSANIAAVEHRLVRTKATSDSWPNDTWSDGVVIKPLTGTSGHGVQAFSSINEARQSLDTSPIEAWAVSPRLKILSETRLIMLDDTVLLAYQKTPKIVDGLPMFNLGKGASAQVVAARSDYVTVATDSLHALNLRLASVDIIETEDGKCMVLEVNDGIMMEYFSRISSEYGQICYEVYRAIVNEMMQIEK